MYCSRAVKRATRVTPFLARIIYSKLLPTSQRQQQEDCRSASYVNCTFSPLSSNCNPFPCGTGTKPKPIGGIRKGTGQAALCLILMYAWTLAGCLTDQKENQFGPFVFFSSSKGQKYEWLAGWTYKETSSSACIRMKKLDCM